jgi:hypothetical protein
LGAKRHLSGLFWAAISISHSMDSAFGKAQQENILTQFILRSLFCVVDRFPYAVHFKFSAKIVGFVPQ